MNTDIEAKGLAVNLTLNYVQFAPHQRDVAAEARHGGRAISQKLAMRIAEWRTPGSYQTVIDTGRLMKDVGGTLIPVPLAALAGDLGVMELNKVWTYNLDPATGTGNPEGRRNGWRWYAQSLANGSGKDRPVMLLTEAEAVVEWPIYREALFGGTPQERSDLHDAIDTAAEDLDYRWRTIGEYEPEDNAEIGAKLQRWSDLIGRLQPVPTPVVD